MATRVTWLGHATVLVELDGARILTDPVLRPRVAHLRRHAAVPVLDGRIDAVLLSHLHRDHADLPTLRRLGPVPVVAPRGGAAALRRAGAASVRELAVGGRLELTPGVTVEAVPARHDSRRHPLGERTEAIGFVLEGSGRVYFAGDTDLFSGMARIGAPELDVALLPVWGWGPSIGDGHLDPERAARAVALLRPRVAIPIHWGTYLPLGLGRRHRGLLERPGAEFAAAVARHAPGTAAVVLRPGGAFEVRDGRDRPAYDGHTPLSPAPRSDIAR